jgi:hypothetical protein
MNERIKELIPRPWTFPYPDREMYSREQMEHLAELIVREYEKLLPENCSWNGPADSPMKGWHVAFVARKHFGLEK